MYNKWDTFRKARMPVGTKLNRKINRIVENIPRVNLLVASGALKKLSLIKALTPQEKQVAKAIIDYIKGHPQAAVDDIHTTAGGKWYKQEILHTKPVGGKGYDRKVTRLKEEVNHVTIKRIYSTLVRRRIILGETRKNAITKY